MLRVWQQNLPQENIAFMGYFFLAAKREQNQGLRDSDCCLEGRTFFYNFYRITLKSIKSQEIVKWLYKFTVLINKIFYRGKTDVKFFLLATGKGFQWKERVKVNYYQGIFGLGFFFFYILLHHPSVGFTSWGIAKGKTSFWKIPFSSLPHLSRKMEPFA